MTLCGGRSARELCIDLCIASLDINRQLLGHGDGDIGGHQAFNGWTRPDEVSVSKGVIGWVSAFATSERPNVAPYAGLLDGFIRLHDATDPEIADFAGSNGALFPWRNPRWGDPGFNVSAPRTPVPQSEALSSIIDGYKQIRRYRAFELCDEWRQLALLFNELLSAHFEIAAGRRASAFERMREHQITTSRKDFGSGKALSFGAFALIQIPLDLSTLETDFRIIRGLVLRSLMATNQIGFRLDQDGRFDRLAHGASSLLGGLCLQLVAAFAERSHVAVCTACADVFFPERKPRVDRGNYCLACKDAKAPRRRAQSRYSAKKRNEATAQ